MSSPGDGQPPAHLEHNHASTMENTELSKAPTPPPAARTILQKIIHFANIVRRIRWRSSTAQAQTAVTAASSSTSPSTQSDNTSTPSLTAASTATRPPTPRRSVIFEPRDRIISRRGRDEETGSHGAPPNGNGIQTAAAQGETISAADAIFSIYTVPTSQGSSGTTSLMSSTSNSASNDNARPPTPPRKVVFDLLARCGGEESGPCDAGQLGGSELRAALGNDDLVVDVEAGAQVETGPDHQSGGCAEESKQEQEQEQKEEQKQLKISILDLGPRLTDSFTNQTDNDEGTGGSGESSQPHRDDRSEEEECNNVYDLARVRTNSSPDAPGAEAAVKPHSGRPSSWTQMELGLLHSGEPKEADNYSTSAPYDVASEDEDDDDEKEPFPPYDDPFLHADHPFWQGEPPSTHPYWEPGALPEDFVTGEMYSWDPPALPRDGGPVYEWGYLRVGKRRNWKRVFQVSHYGLQPEGPG